jgi:pimeloyl-ACP methyl ester carboxylesterase
VKRQYFVPETREDAQRIVDAVFGNESKQLPGFILDAMIRRSRDSVSARALDEVDNARYIDEHLEELQVPTEVIWGTGDTMLPIAHAYQFEEKIPDVRLHLMVGAGHSPQVGSPDAFNRLLRQVIE